MAILDVLHMCAVTEILERTGAHSWTTCKIWMDLTMHLGGANIRQVKAIKLSMLYYRYLVIVRKKPLSVDNMEDIFNCMREFELQFWSTPYR